jgi:phage-related protein
MLRENLGITKDKLLDAGWDGSAEDIDGYTRALGECLKQSGDVSDMMNTTSGKLTRIKKYWSLAGRSLGDEFLPYVDQALDHLVRFLDADNDGALDERGKKWMQYAYGAMAVASGFATLAPSIAPALSALDNLAGKTKSVLTFFGLMKGAEDALTISTLSNTIAEKANTIAKMAGGTAAVTATGANAGLTASLWAMATALLANPITWVVVALIALAAAVYEVGKAFGWWTDVGSMLQAIWAGIQRLWSAFINHPDVQAALQAIGSALSWLGGQIMGAIKAVLQFFNISTGSNWDIVSTIIHGIGNAWNSLRPYVMGAISVLQSAFSFLASLVGTAVGIGQGIYEALKPIVCIILGCSPGIVPALQTLYEMFIAVWNEILSFVSGIISSVVAAIQPIIDILTQIAEFYLSTFIFAWQTLIMIFTTVITAVNQIITIFSMFLSGQISLSTMLSMVWNTIQVMFATVLNIIINRVRTFATAIVARALAAGRGFVNGIITFLTTLPGRVWSILVNVTSRIISAGSQWISNATSKAQAIVTGVISNISQLPGKVYTEFMNIGSRMMEAGSQLVEKAKEIGKNIVDGILNAMQIHSPGIIQTKVVTEFKNMVKKVAEYIKPAGETAKEFGDTMVTEFGDVELTPNIGYKDLDAQEMPNMNMNVGMDTSTVDSTTNMVTSSYDNLANLTGNALQTMVDKDKLAYETIRNNDANTLTLMSTTLSQKMGTMSSNVNTNLNNIVAKNRTSMSNVNNTTKSNLNSIVSKTKNANTQMIKSWEVMKNGIIKAADKIKSESTDHFNKLSNTIGTFYGKLKNPSRWGAGSPMPSSRGRRSHGFGKITNAIQNASLPKYLSLGQIKRNPLIHMNDFGDYVTRDKKTGLFTVSDLLKYGAIQIGKGAGGYDTIPAPNVKLIKDTSNEWDMKGPLVGKYQTNHGFKVKEFLTGVPKITFDVFRSIAEDVFGQTQYEFYYDDDHHGNWVNAFNAGSMNCKHGAEAIIALAETMGLSGHMVHGHWNQYGHYWAEIEGHKMDVTGWQQRRTWTPSASAGPSPKNSVSNLFNEISSKSKSDKDSKVEVEETINLNLDFQNLPKDIDIDTLISALTSPKVLEALTHNSRFQELDTQVKQRIIARTKRATG